MQSFAWPWHGRTHQNKPIFWNKYSLFWATSKSTSINFMIIGDSFSIVIYFIVSCALEIFGHTLCNKQAWDLGNLYKARNVAINRVYESLVVKWWIFPRYMNLKCKDEIETSISFDNLMEEDANIAIDISCLVFHIKKEVVAVLDFYFLFLRR